MNNINKIVLHTNAVFDENHLVTLAQNLSNLEDMTIYHNETYQINFDTIKQMLQCAYHLYDLSITWPSNHIHYFDENDYNELLNIVKNRYTHKRLHLVFTNKTTFFR